MPLDRYRNKRNPAATPEPFASDPLTTGPTTKGQFVVHHHLATREHFDLRLEVGGVLKSFAVPKGPSLDPSIKSLAIHTEDHPEEYLDFEGIIPEGQYGAGSMIVWDRGAVTYRDDPAETGLQKGKIDFDLWGHKLRGRFALVRLKESPTEWLLFKKKDAYASVELPVVQAKPHSVLSGRRAEDLAGAPLALQNLLARIDAMTQQPRSEGPPAPAMTPMLCNEGQDVPLARKGWIYELKLDGIRGVAHRNGRAVSIRSRSDRDIAPAFPELLAALRAIPAAQFVLDGELVLFGDSGGPSFSSLMSRLSAKTPDPKSPVTFAVFDVLSLEGRDLRALPLRERKSIVRQLIPAPGFLRALDHLEDDGTPLWSFCQAHGLEGIVAKRFDSPYASGSRGGDWLKKKRRVTSRVFVAGLCPGEGHRKALGSVDVVERDMATGAWVYRGRVGTGLTDTATNAILQRTMVVDTIPLSKGEAARAPRDPSRRWVEPELAITIASVGLTEEGYFREPVFLSLDEASLDLHEQQLEAQAERAAAELSSHRAPTLTNPQKVLFGQSGYTKTDLWNYYDRIAPTLLPYLRDRPIVMVRYPDGIAGHSFFQWNPPAGLPDWIGCVELPERAPDEAPKYALVIDNVEGLQVLANLAVIPIHILASRTPSPALCDFITFDFDVEPKSLIEVVPAVVTLKRILDTIGAPSFVKLSGHQGVHVLVPLANATFPMGQALTDLLAALVVREHPGLITTERRKEARRGAALLDTGQVGPRRTIVAPYAVRAAPGAPVSVPLQWHELEPTIDPREFSIQSVPERVARHGDPMDQLLTSGVPLPPLLEALKPII